jgi:multidrug efflux pump subunit AcrA (membrane-fusion protein)
MKKWIMITIVILFGAVIVGFQHTAKQTSEKSTTMKDVAIYASMINLTGKSRQTFYEPGRRKPP